MVKQKLYVFKELFPQSTNVAPNRQRQLILTRAEEIDINIVKTTTDAQ